MKTLGSVLLAISFVAACSSDDKPSTSSSSTSGGATDGTSGGTTDGTSGGAAGGLTGTCATLKSCCATVETSKQAGCNYSADNSQNNEGVCTDALKSYPTCGGGSGGTSSSSGSSGCGPAGADPVDTPAACATLAGACIYHESETVEHGAKIVCMQFSGQYSQIKDSAGTQCTNGGPAGKHEWKPDMKCSDVVQGIQGGCQNHANGATLCTTSYYGQGCTTGLGGTCNSEKSLNGVWVKP